MLALCHALGFVPAAIEEVSGIEATIGLIACGFGIALLPSAWERMLSVSEIGLQPIVDSNDWCFRVGVCWRRDARSALIERAISIAKTLKTAPIDRPPLRS